MKADVVHVKKTRVVCSGIQNLYGEDMISTHSSAGSAAGHPKVYLYVENTTKCPYCGKCFILDT